MLKRLPSLRIALFLTALFAIFATAAAAGPHFAFIDAVGEFFGVKPATSGVSPMYVEKPSATPTPQLDAPLGNSCVSNVTTGNWNTAATWTNCGGVVPTSADDVTIANGHTITIDTSPSVSSLNVVGTLQYDASSGRNLTVSGNVTIAGTYMASAAFVSTGTSQTLTIGGSLANNGTFTTRQTGSTSGTRVINVVMNGASAVTLSGSASSIDFNLLTVNLGSAATTITPSINVNFINSTGTAFTFTQGKWVQNSNTTIIPANALTVTTTSELSVGGGTFTVSTASLTITGKMTLTSGTVNVGNAIANSLSITGASANAQISGGTINVAGRWDQSSSATANVTGGSVNVSTAGQVNSAGSATFSVSSTCTFTMGSGTGSVKVYNANSNTGGDFKILTNTALTAGTLIVGNSGGTTGNIQIQSTPALNNLQIDAGATNPALAANLSVNGTLTLTTGTLNNTGFTLTLGNAATILRDTGSLSAAPTFGTSVNVSYTGTTAVTTGNEIPAATTVLNDLTINKSGGVTLNTAATAKGTLTLTNGKLATTGTNLLTISNTSANAVAGGSSSSYVNGPIARLLPASLVSGSTYLFPVGKTTYQPFEMVNPTTSVTATIRSEEFDGSSGGSPGSGIGALKTNRYWQASVTSGSFTNTSVRLTDSTVAAGNVIGKSATQTGTYDSIGGTVSGGKVLSNTITSFSFFNIGTGLVAPTTQASNITFSNVQANQLDINWTNGNGSKRIVKMNSSNSFANPVDGNDPTANASWQNGGEQVIVNTTGSTTTVFGLIPGAMYFFRVYEANGVSSSIVFNTNTATNNPNGQATILLKFRSKGTGNWNATSTWEMSTDGGSTWVAATSTPTSADGAVTIRDSDSVLVTANVTVDEVTVEGSLEIHTGNTLTVNDGPGVDLIDSGNISVGGTGLIIGPGSFLMNPGKGLTVGSPDGISSSGATGSVQTATRTFDAAGNYSFNAASNQITGTGLPSTASNLTIAGSDIVLTLTNSLTVGYLNPLGGNSISIGTNTLTITSSVLANDNSITSSPTGTVSFNQPSNGQFVPGGTYGNVTFSNFNKLISNGAPINIAGTFTPGSATGHTISGTTFNFNGASAQTIPAFTFNSLSINNAAGVALTGSVLVGGTLTLNSGTVITTAINLLTITNTPANAISGGSASSYVSGPLARYLPASLGSGSTYLFPVGKGSYNPFELVNPTTTSGGTVVFQAEEFDGNSGGTAGSGMGALNTNRYWQASITANSASFISTSVRLTETGVAAGSRIGKSATQSGAYDSIGGTVSGSTILSDPIISFSYFVTGSPAVTPTITGAATATAFTTTYGTPSTAQTFPVSGANLTADLVATAPAGFEVSNDGISYGPTATFIQSGGLASGTLGIRLKATAPVAGSYNSQDIVLSSTGASPVNITTAASGNTVSPASVTITASSPTVVYGEAVPTITPGYGMFQNGENSSVVTTLPICSTAYTTSSPAGSSPLTSCVGAVAANYTFSYTPGTVTVGVADTTTAVISDNNPSAFGQTVMFTATVTATSPSIGVPTGTVTFVRNSSPITGCVNVPVSSGQAVCSTAALAVASHTIFTTFSGDTNFTGSVGNLTGNPQVVNQATTTTAIVVTPVSPVFGQALSYAATVSPQFSGTPAGNVAFSVDTVAVASCTAQPLVAGVATCNPAGVLGVGPHTVTTTYLGDGNFTGSNGSQAFTVAQASTTTTILDDFPDSSKVGQNVQVDVSVVGVAGNPPTGSVDVSDGVNSCSAGLDPFGGGSCTVALTTPGSRTLTATYSGDTNYLPGSTDTEPHAVVAPPSIAKSFSPASVEVGGTSTLTITITNPVENTVALTGVGFTDTFPATMAIGTTPTATFTNCGPGIITDDTNGGLGAGDTGIKLTGATVAVGTPCFFSIDITATATGTNTVQVTSGNGGTGNTASATLSIGEPVLAVTKSHSVTFTQGAAAAWTVQVTNNGANATDVTNGTVTVSDTLPSGYGYTGFSGSGWSCAFVNPTVTCSNSTVVAGAGGQFGDLTLNVTVPANSPASVTNTALAYGGGDLTHSNAGTAATGSDVVTVVQVPASIHLTSGNNQSVAVNTAFPINLAATVLDAGNVPVSGATVTFTAPASGASGTFAGGTNVKTAATDATGLATATVYTANAIAGGPYNVGVAAGSVSNNFTESNLATGMSTQSFNCTPFPITFANSNGSGSVTCPAFSGGGILTGVSLGMFADYQFGGVSNDIGVTFNLTNPAGVTWASSSVVLDVTGGTSSSTLAQGSDTATAGISNANFVAPFNVGVSSSVIAGLAASSSAAAMVTYTYKTQYQLTTAAGVGGMVSPASGMFYDSGTVVPVMATPNTGFNFGSWTGPVASTSSASTTVTMDAAKSITANFLGPASMTANSTTTPQSAMINTLFGNAPAVTVRDSANNPVSGVNVTFTAPGSGASGMFSNNTQMITVITNALGIAAAPFTANSTVGGPYNVTATSGVLTAVNFSLTNIAGPATHFSITAPANATAGTSFGFTVTALDANNNVAAGYSGTVHFTSTDNSPAALPANATLVNGVGTFGSTMFKAGVQTIGAYDTVNNSIAGTSNDITVGPGTAYSLKITAPANVMPGVPFNFTVTGVDAYGNTGALGTGNVHFTSTDGLATLPADAQLVNGSGTFSATLRTPGGWAILASDVSLAISGSSNNINVASLHFAVVAPATATQGTAFNFTVTAQDLFNNTAAGYTGMVHFTSTDGSATLPGDATLTNGVGTFNATLRTIGTQTITATDTNAPVTGTSNGINVQNPVTTGVKARADFDGDGKTDISVFRPSNGIWFLNRSQAGFAAVQFGMSGDIITPADFTGDGKADVAVWRPTDGTWYVMRSEDSTVYEFGFGQNGDLPVAADFDGDGRADMAVYRPSQGTWYIMRSTAGFMGVQFGTAEDKPVVGDYDGDGKADISLFRPSNGTWYRINSSNGSPFWAQFGEAGDIPLVMDYDGDGKANLAVFRPGDNTWYMARPTGVPAQNFDALQFGATDDIPVPGDYDGDGKTDIAVYRPSTGIWFILRSTLGFTALQFGTAEDRPTQSAYVY